MSRTVVGILRGGPSAEFDASLATGAALMQALPDERYDTRDIFIDRSGTWHLQGRPAEPLRILGQLDVALNALHGAYGEDGTVQRVLERSGTPFTGARSAPAALTVRKGQAHARLRQVGIRMPRGIVFTQEEDATIPPQELAKMVFAQFGPPYVLKPENHGSSIGVTLSASIVDLPAMLAEMLDRYDTVLVQEYLVGAEASVGIIDGFRYEDDYTLPPVEVTRRGAWLTAAEKYGADAALNCPSAFSNESKRSLEAAARQVHRALGLTHHSVSDFIVRPNGAVYFLEVNAVPKLGASRSPVRSALDAVGSSLSEFAEHLVKRATDRA